MILLAFTPLIVAAFIRACRLVLGAPPRWTAFLCGVLVFAPVPILVRFFVLPGVAWLALFGLSVPVAMVERLGFRGALVRGRRLALAVSRCRHPVGPLSRRRKAQRRVEWRPAPLEFQLEAADGQRPRRRVAEDRLCPSRTDMPARITPLARWTGRSPPA